MESDIDAWCNEIVNPRPNHSGLPIYDVNSIITEIYRSNASDLGLLSDREVEKLSNFYSLAIRVQRQHKICKDEESRTALTTHTLLRNVVDLKDMKNNILNGIESNLPEVSRTQSNRYEVNLEGTDLDKVIKEHSQKDHRMIHRG